MAVRARKGTCKSSLEMITLSGRLALEYKSHTEYLNVLLVRQGQAERLINILFSKTINPFYNKNS